MNTFEIRQEYLALDALLNEVDEETGEFLNNQEDIQDYVDNLEDTRGSKLINIERYKRDIKGQADTLALEIKRLQTLKKQKENVIERLTDLEMELTQGQKIDTGLFKFGIRKSKSVVVDDENNIPDQYFKIKKEVNKTELKKAIEEANKKGEAFIGAVIVEKTSLSVR